MAASKNKWIERAEHDGIDSFAEKRNDALRS